MKTDMEQLKVKKKDIIITNTTIFLLLAFLFLCLQHAYRYHLSPFSWTYLRKSLELFWYVALPLVISCILIWRHHRWALITYTFSIAMISFKVIEGLFIEFNKIIVIALFFFIVISYFIYQLMAHYLSLAQINPNYSSTDLFDPLLRTIPVHIEQGGTSTSGYLTNWDEEGCFLRLMENKKSVSGQINVIISFRGREFVQQGEVVAQSVDFTGIGVKFKQAPKDLRVFNWTEFIELIEELGFIPERLR
jgi:hypothetical protein